MSRRGFFQGLLGAAATAFAANYLPLVKVAPPQPMSGTEVERAWEERLHAMSAMFMDALFYNPGPERGSK